MEHGWPHYVALHSLPPFSPYSLACYLDLEFDPSAHLHTTLDTVVKFLKNWTRVSGRKLHDKNLLSDIRTHNMKYYNVPFGKLSTRKLQKENDGVTENAGPVKCRTWKMTDQFTGLKNAGPNQKASKHCNCNTANKRLYTMESDNK